MHLDVLFASQLVRFFLACSGQGRSPNPTNKVSSLFILYC